MVKKEVKKSTKKVVKKTSVNHKDNTKKVESKKNNAKKVETNSKNVKTNQIWQIATIILTILLLSSLVYIFTDINKNNNNNSDNLVLSKVEITNKTMDFINKQLLQGKAIGEFKNISEKNGLYLLNVNIQGQDFGIYVTKDGDMIFPQGISMNEIIENPQNKEQQKVPEVKKSDIPKIELFVMSYCPYGTQIEKGIIPVINLLKDKVNFELKFVNYAMHPSQGEVQEQLLQYCIQKQYKDKFLVYLSKFLEKGNTDEALNTIGISRDDLKDCIEETDTKFDITKNFEDKASWSGGRFPKFMIYDADNQKYGIQGSPSLVINEAQINTGRDAQSLLKTICNSFNNAPEECNTDLSSLGIPSPGFGFDKASGASTGNAGCAG